MGEEAGVSENICGCGCRCEVCSPATTLRARVRLMRELGVTEYDGIVLGPEPPPPTQPATPEARRRDRDEHHLRFWRQVTRASGAPIPVCTPTCRCGAGADDGEA